MSPLTSTQDLGTFTPPLPAPMSPRAFVADLLATVREARQERALYSAVSRVERGGADPLAYVIACETAREILAERAR